MAMTTVMVLGVARNVTVSAVFATVTTVVLEMTVVTVTSEMACTNEINGDDCDCSDGCDGCRRSSFYDCDEFFCLGRMR